MVFKQVSKLTSKLIPSPGRGILTTAVTGIGADRVMRLIDNVVGSPVQRLFSFNLPLIGTVGPIEALNYFGHSRGKLISRTGIVALLSAKIAEQAITQIGPIKLPGIGPSFVNPAGGTVSTGVESGGASF